MRCVFRGRRCCLADGSAEETVQYFAVGSTFTPFIFVSSESSEGYFGNGITFSIGKSSFV